MSISTRNWGSVSVGMENGSSASVKKMEQCEGRANLDSQSVQKMKTVQMYCR